VIQRLALGAPGIYSLPEEPLRALTDVRMDVCAFVGVAPRGPARVPYFKTESAREPCAPGRTVTRSVAVAVESRDAYTRLYGGFEGPSLLPYAVASFFDNGGRRAYVVRIVHEYLLADGTPDVAKNEAGIARGAFPDLAASAGRRVWLRARNEGRWGNRLSARLTFKTRTLAFAPADFHPTELRVPAGVELVEGALLRLSLSGGARVLRRVATLREEWHPTKGMKETWATLDLTTVVPGERAELVEGVLEIDDGADRDDGVDRTEIHERLGLSSKHPRWLATVLVEDSALVYPAEDPGQPKGDPLARWDDADLELPVTLGEHRTASFQGGEDRYRDIVPDDFFDPAWTLGDECPGAGVQALTELSDLSLLVVPDLYSPHPLLPAENILDEAGLAGAEFDDCVVPPPSATQEVPAEGLDGLSLDPAADLDRIAALQNRLVELADQLQSFIVLLDVPPALSQRRMLYWRGKFDSAYAAAYHPWLKVARPEDRRDALISVNPSAVAAGIIARREIELGVPHGPANVIAAGVVNVEDRVAPARHDELHPAGVNVYLLERDGVRLTAARTVSQDPAWRQLSVRRLVTMLRRVLERQMQWAVFEPNNAKLRADVRHMLEAYLRQLFLGNAFAGAREEEAFFVRCDEELNPRAVTDQGRLIAQVGVAPAEPLEFIVLQISRDGNGAVQVAE
jgi:hypothetical protein